MNGLLPAGLWLSALLFTGCSSLAGRRPFDAGCLASLDTDLQGNRRLRVAGPIFEKRERDDGKSFVAVRPFYSRTEEPAVHRKLEEYAWPLAIRKTAFGSTYWLFLAGLGFGHDYDPGSPDSRYRRIILPFYFEGRDKYGERYFAIFPFGGTIHEFLLKDRMDFVLFPIYGHSQVKDKESWSVLWPIIAWQRGGDRHGYRVFPLYGRQVNENEWVKQFVLWPFWTSVRYEAPSYGGGGFILFPIVGHLGTPTQKQWMVIPPFFRWSESTRGDFQLNCPWPFVQYSSGQEDKLYLWPLWGRKAIEDVRSQFFLWPIGTIQRTDRETRVLRRVQVRPLVYYESLAELTRRYDEPGAADGDLPPPGTGTASEKKKDRRYDQKVEKDVLARYLTLWPLFSYQRESGSSSFNTLALWPTKRAMPVERNLAPLWTLYSRSRVGQASEQELLWGLYRSRVDAGGGRRASLFPLYASEKETNGEGSRRWSLLYGLAGYEREGLRRTFRLLYFIRFRLQDADVRPVQSKRPEPDVAGEPPRRDSGGDPAGSRDPAKQSGAS